MAEKSIEQLVEQYQVEHAYNEEARQELGKAMAALPVSDYGEFKWYTVDWAVEICWHTPRSKVYWAVCLVPHKHDFEDHCERDCDVAWNIIPFDNALVTRAIAQALVARTKDLEIETSEMRKAITAFSKKQIGFAELRALAE